ncbi:MAG: hypothetical protein EOM26_01120 [Alphaproteobacteria bacterium]|nr:hypothetical protein [Alphaproteobacteria bacterium]
MERPVSLFVLLTRPTLLGLGIGLSLLNFTPALQWLAEPSGEDCDRFDLLIQKQEHAALKSDIGDLDLSGKIFRYAAKKRQKICRATVDNGTDAEYHPVSDVFHVRTPNPGGWEEKSRGYRQRNLTTHAHELLHSFQRNSSAVSLSTLGRRYDVYSNVLAVLYTEAAAYAYQTLATHEYYLEHPEQVGDIRFSHAGDLLAVFREALSGLDRNHPGMSGNEKKNLAARAVFEDYLTADTGPVLLARMHYLKPFIEDQASSLPRLDRLFAGRRLGLEDIKSLTHFPDGFQLYDYDRLPLPGELNSGILLPGAEKLTDNPLESLVLK